MNRLGTISACALMILVSFSVGAEEVLWGYTCSDVIKAVQTLPKETKVLIKAQMTQEQIKAARRCLLKRHVLAAF